MANKMEWIPVTKALPDKPGEYLCTTITYMIKFILKSTTALTPLGQLGQIRISQLGCRYLNLII